MADKFRKNFKYTLNSSLRDNFYHNTSSNPGIMRELEEHGGSFTVLELNDSYRPTKVIFDDGLVYEINEHGVNRGMLFYLFSDEARYFDEVHDEKKWKACSTYICTNPEALIENSEMNRRFVSMVGKRPFEVLTMHSVLHAGTDGRTGKIRFSDEATGEDVEMYFTFTQYERNFFKEVDSDYIHFEADDEEALEEVFSESEEKEFIAKVAQGLIRFEVDDEMTRLKAIEFLNSIKFEK